MNKNKYENGSIKISNDIFYMITAMATLEVDGVKHIVGIPEDAEKINEEIVKKIQENIKLKIEIMTSIKVLGVNICIESIEK